MNNKYKLTKKVSLILPYYGIFPNYFRNWIEGAKNNPKIDFYIVTDSNEIDGWCKENNLHVIKLSMSAIKERIEKIVGTKVCLSRPYKLCDYKPTYGAIFSELLKDSDYWGYIDPDVVIGDMSIIINDDMLSRYNIVGGVAP